MKTYWALAAITLAALSGNAAAEDRVVYRDGAYVMTFEKVDLSRSADRQRMLAVIQESGERTCAAELTRTGRATCVQDYVAATIKSIARADVQSALAEAQGAGSKLAALTP